MFGLIITDKKYVIPIEKSERSGYFFFREVYGRITLPQPATFPVDLRDFLHVSQRFGQHVAMKQMN